VAAPICATALAILVCTLLHVGDYFVQRIEPTIPRADTLFRYARPEDRLRDYLAWRETCRWIHETDVIPTDARFLTPRVASTFKWYAGRAEVANWKETPQDPESIVDWWNRLHDLYAAGGNDPGSRWHESLATQGADRLRELGEKYDADYVITRTFPWVHGLDVVYWNKGDPLGPLYVVYKLR
jgi:hypothetical protein